MKIGAIRALAGLLCFAFLWASPAKAEWRRAESPNFILYGNLPQTELRQRILKLEDFDHLLRILMAVTEPPSPNKLHIYLVDNGRDLRTIRQLPAGFAGFYTATPEGVAAFVDNSADASGNELLFHEYAHHFMMQYRPNAYPAWYVEGFAEYFMTARFNGRQIDIGNYSPGSAYAIMEREWLPMDQVLHGQPQSFHGDAIGQFYAQAWILVHYFYSTPERQAALGRYLVASRSDNRGALLAATGMDAAALTQELHRYIGHGQIEFRRMTRPEGETPPPVTVTSLPRGADDLMLYEAALRIGIEDAQGPDLLARIRAAAARHEGDPFAQRVLAHAELLYGDAAAADRLLDPLIAASPGDAELLYLKGMRYLVAAEHDDAQWDANARTARTWFGRAHQADANHYQTLYRYAESLRRDREYASENNVNVLLLAHQLAPQVAEITMNAAALLIGRQDYGVAAPLLRPLAGDPHNASLAHAAQELLDRDLAGMRAHMPAAQARPSREGGAPASAVPPPPPRPN